MKKYVWYEDLDGVIVCPSCGTYLDGFYRDSMHIEDDGPVRFEPAFCPDCGQALDWTETLPYGAKEEQILHGLDQSNA